MLHHGAQVGAFNLQTILGEAFMGMRSAGADAIIYYFTQHTATIFVQ